jgi:Ribosomal protein L22p/L17e
MLTLIVHKLLYLQRATAVAKIFHEAIPEELFVKEVMVTKGNAQKRMRIMGRGRTGVGYTRKAHITIKVEVINFAHMIAKAKTHSQKAKWAKIEEIVLKKRLAGATGASTFQAKASE